MKEQGKKIRNAAMNKNLLPTKPISHGVGRRKTSVAVTWLRHGNGEFTVNGKKLDSYFSTDLANKLALESIKKVEAEKIFSLQINVKGGGIYSQAGAVRLSVARALSAFNEDYRKVLRAGDFVTVDARKKERKKPGQKAARRKFQFVKR
jgi:small subunit ribosomal protein S9